MCEERADESHGDSSWLSPDFRASEVIRILGIFMNFWFRTMLKLSRDFRRNVFQRIPSLSLDSGSTT